VSGPVTEEERPTHIESTASADLTLAHLHLRLGSIALARAELETLAGRDALDRAGLADLAEVRWRTGDLAGAGEAAAAVLPDGDGPLIALVVAAEAAFERGRPTEARRYADRAMTEDPGAIDRLFAGMPRGPVWPADPVAVVAIAPTLFGTTTGAGSMGGPGSDPRPAEPLMAVGATTVAEVSGLPESPTVAIWEADDLQRETPQPPAADDPDPTMSLPTGDVALQAGRQAIATGDLDDAVILLSLVLRLAPPLAPAVLDAIDGRTERALALVRGDAYRLVGQEREARLAFADAARPETDRDEAAGAQTDGPPNEAGPELLIDPPAEGDPS
jgi:tetratricopeptide (TPR) repeat protein